MRRWDREGPYIEAIFRRYWEQNDATIAELGGLREVAAEIGVDPADFEAECESAPVRQALIEATNAALARGVFGAPTFIVNDEIFWGKDRMEFVEDELRRTG